MDIHEIQDKLNVQRRLNLVSVAFRGSSDNNLFVYINDSLERKLQLTVIDRYITEN